jgi:hypothetical protein
MLNVTTLGIICFSEVGIIYFAVIHVMGSELLLPHCVFMMANQSGVQSWD